MLTGRCTATWWVLDWVSGRYPSRRDPPPNTPHTDRQIKFHEITIVLLTLAHQIHPAQNALFLEAWARALRNLQLAKVCKKYDESFAFIASFLLQKVTHLDFSWVSPCPDEVPDLAKGSQAPGSNVTINFSKRSVVINLRQFSIFLNLF